MTTKSGVAGQILGVIRTGKKENLNTMSVGDYAIIVYDYIEPEYEHTDVRIEKIRCQQDGVWYVVERWDGSRAKYHEHCLQTFEDKYLDPAAELPEVPKCTCPIRMLMMKGCQCGGI